MDSRARNGDPVGKKLWTPSGPKCCKLCGVSFTPSGSRSTHCAACNPRRKRVGRAPWTSVIKRVCPLCGQEFQLGHARQIYCKACIPNKKSWTRWTSHRMTETEFVSRLASQHGRCAVCGDPLPAEAALVDHDHSCCSGQKTCGKCVRGLVCSACNLGLGNLENLAWSVPALAYLKSYA